MKVSSLYIHVPFCRHLCNYCDFFKYKVGDVRAPKWEDYEKQLTSQWKELREREKAFQVESSALKTVYLGGGTPSLWGWRGIQFLEDHFKQNNLYFSDNYQFTLEVDPGTITGEELDQWINLGVNRFSLGIQTLDPDFIHIADRKHSIQDAQALLVELSQRKLDFSVDFLLGLPDIGCKRSIKDELDEILSYKPAHLSLYMLTVPSSYEHYDDLPDEDSTAEEYIFVSDYLRSKGFEHYEVSNFSLKGKQSSHNYTYWEGRSYWGLGASATGQWRSANDEMLRYVWTPSGKFKEEKLGKSELDLEKLHLSFRTSSGFALSDFEDSEYYVALRSKISSWINDGLLIEHNKRFSCTPKGYLLSESLVDQVFSG